ncbi:hypothetical protein D3C76_1353060 [compost metagenome]
MKVAIQVYLYGFFASGGLCLLVAKDTSLTNYFVSCFLSWGGFAARTVEVLSR